MADAVDIITLQEAKEFLDISLATDDAELAGFVTAASRLWVGRVGPVNPTAFDEWYDGGTPRIVLRRWPLLTVDLVEESFGPIKYTLTESSGTWSYFVDKSTGLLLRRVMNITTPFAYGQRNIHVQYTAGYTTAPADIKQAVALLVQHMWATQRGRTRVRGGSDEWRPDFAFTWPSRVEAYAASYSVPGIA
jgi:hypothetical protein